MDDLRRDYFAALAEIDTAEREALARRLVEQERADQAASDSRRRRATQEVQDLTRDLDDRFRINSAYEERVRRLREAEAAGGVTAAERSRLETLALQERDEALRRIEGTTRRTAAIPRADREAERELNDLIRERERLILENETAYERYQRRLERLADLAERAERAGRPIPAETIGREAERALGELEETERRLQRSTENTRDAARDLGFAFSSAFEDAIVRGERLSQILKGLLQDITRIIARRTITEPLGNAVSSGLSGLGVGNWLTDIGNAIGGLFRAEGGPVAAGQPYIVGERGPEWFVPRQTGTVLPNGTAPGATTINTSIAIDARGADAGVEARLRILAGQIARQASSMTLDAIRRGGSAYETVRG